VTSYVPPGWPAGVHPPGSAEFEQTAVAWLLGVVPPDYLLHGVLRRHPIALASLARHHLTACVEGARRGYRTARSELGPSLPPSAVEAVLTAYRSEGRRLADAARATDLIERAMHGEVFVRQLGGARPDTSRTAGRRPGPARSSPKTPRTTGADPQSSGSADAGSEPSRAPRSGPAPPRSAGAGPAAVPHRREAGSGPGAVPPRSAEAGPGAVPRRREAG
jgi:hypothetical protein